jgi:hypothetical protein
MDISDAHFSYFFSTFRGRVGVSAHHDRRSELAEMFLQDRNLEQGSQVGSLFRATLTHFRRKNTCVQN